MALREAGSRPLELLLWRLLRSLVAAWVLPLGVLSLKEGHIDVCLIDDGSHFVPPYRIIQNHNRYCSCFFFVPPLCQIESRLLFALDLGAATGAALSGEPKKTRCGANRGRSATASRHFGVIGCWVMAPGYLG